MGFGVYRSGSTLATSLALVHRYPGSVFESPPVSSNGTQSRLPSPDVSFLFARRLHPYTSCAPLLVAFLLVFLLIMYISKFDDHDSKSRPCKRLHAIFTKAGLEPPLPPYPPVKWHPVFRIYITPALPGLSRSQTGSVLGRHHRHRSNRNRLPGPNFEKVMEDIWESSQEVLGLEG